MTMSQEYSEIQKMSPDKLVRMFSRSHVGVAVLLALLIHVVFVGAMSVNYIWETYIAPEQAQAAAAAATNTVDEAAVTASDTNTAAVASPAAAGAAGSGTPAATAQGAAAANMEGIPEQYRDSEVVRSVTEASKPEDIPSMPDPIGVPLGTEDPFAN
jgi:hypothetical protein